MSDTAQGGLMLAGFVVGLFGLNVLGQMFVHWLGVRAEERRFDRLLEARRQGQAP